MQAFRVMSGEVAGVEGGKRSCKLSMTVGGQRVFSKEERVEWDMPEQRRLGDDVRAVGKNHRLSCRGISWLQPVVHFPKWCVGEVSIRRAAEDRVSK